MDAARTLSDDTPAARLGFAVKVLGREGMKSNDARRWQSGPHLSVSIEYLREIFAYLDAADIRMYRMSSDLAPYCTHPDLPQFHGQVRECAGELEALGDLARSLRLRLSMHPAQFIVLNSPDPALVARSVLDLTAAAELLDVMRLGPEAVLVVHAGGTYGDREGGRARWVETYRRTLPEPVRRRLVLENDDLRYGAADVLKIHDETGVPLVFDHQHYWCFNPEGVPLAPTVCRFLDTWPVGVRPKIHFSTPATATRDVKRGKGKAAGTASLPPVWTGHADYVDPFAFAAFLRSLPDGTTPAFDVMLEAKAKDLALLRLRRDLPRYAPDLAPRFGLSAVPMKDVLSGESEAGVGDSPGGDETA